MGVPVIVERPVLSQGNWRARLPDRVTTVDEKGAHRGGLMSENAAAAELAP